MAAPSLFQISARDWLLRAGSNGKPLSTLADIPESELDKIAEFGFNWLYLLGVWQTGEIGRQISLKCEAWKPGYSRALSAFDESAVSGSPFAVQRYTVHGDFGGDDALASLRDRLQARGIHLMLDFVPNHVAIDHDWTTTHPDRIVRGAEADAEREPGNFVRYAGQVFAHGRDPYFPGWVDTVQLDYSNPATRAAMAGELEKIAGQCDGLRCDMAMLILPQIFERTWGRRVPLFWPDAIGKLRTSQPNFVMMAEVYWGLEWELQQQGFDFTYDKTLYDRLLNKEAGAIRSHLQADIQFQARLARFLENHDEPRIAEELPFEPHRAAALIAYSVPGLRFFHDGQLSGATRKPSIHLAYREREPVNEPILKFYRWLVPYAARSFTGDWQLLDSHAAWTENPTAAAIIATAWLRDGQIRSLVIANYSPHQSQAYVALRGGLSSAPSTKLMDVLAGTSYERSTADLSNRGLYVDLAAWGAHLFEFST